MGTEREKMNSIISKGWIECAKPMENSQANQIGQLGINYEKILNKQKIM